MKKSIDFRNLLVYVGVLVLPLFFVIASAITITKIDIIAIAAGCIVYWLVVGVTAKKWKIALSIIPIFFLVLLGLSFLPWKPSPRMLLWYYPLVVVGILLCLLVNHSSSIFRKKKKDDDDD